jgi:hypothetical protein
VSVDVSVNVDVNGDGDVNGGVVARDFLHASTSDHDVHVHVHVHDHVDHTVTSPRAPPLSRNNHALARVPRACSRVRSPFLSRVCRQTLPHGA